MSKAAIEKTWEIPHVEARCLAPLCDQGPWVADGNWPMAAAANHARASGHRTRAISTAEVTYSSVTPTDGDGPAPTSTPSA